jgi:site-specific recombinase XerD
MANQKGKKMEMGIWRCPEGDGYLAEVSYPDPESGVRVRVQKTTNRIDLARQWRQTTKADALRGEIRRTKASKSRPFDEYATEYLESWSKVEKRPSSYARDMISVKHLTGCFGSTDIARITRRDVEQYVASRKAAGLAAGTMNRELSCLKNMFRKAVDWGYLETNPAWGVKQQREEVEEREFLTEEEAERLIQVCPPHTKPIVIVALNTGMRRGEILNLQWRDVDFSKGERGMITVRTSKNHDSRHIPMNEKVAAALRGIPRNIARGRDESYVFAKSTGEGIKSIRNGFEAAVRRVKLEKHISFHDLRHTFASWLVMRGVDLTTVAKLMGHRDIRVTMRYSHLAPDHLQSAVDVLDAGAGEVRRHGT